LSLSATVLYLVTFDFLSFYFWRTAACKLHVHYLKRTMVLILSSVREKSCSDFNYQHANVPSMFEAKTLGQPEQESTI